MNPPQIVVQLAGKHLVGRLAVLNGTSYFEYDAGFIESGHQLSPLHLPLQPGAIECRKKHLLNLPGLCFDSLPDDWGTKVAQRWFSEKHQRVGEIHPHELLCFIGPRGVGALTYSPDLQASTPLRPEFADALNLRLMETTAAAIESDASSLPNLEALASNGTAGGARPKMWIAIKGEGESLRLVSGSADAPNGFTPYLLKFDLSDSATTNREYGLAEHAYALMARAAGIRIPDTRIIPSPTSSGHIRSHFAIARFDRLADNRRAHFHSFAGLNELDFNAPHDYRDLLDVTDRVTRDKREVSELFRRIVFNVLARVRDDHAKNHGFLYNPEAPTPQRWKLSPAYDACYASPARFPKHALSVAGEAVRPTTSHLLMLAEEYDVHEADSIIAHVREIIKAWPDFATKAGLSPLRMEEIRVNLPFTRPN